MTRTLFTGLAPVLLTGCADEPTTPPLGQTTPSRGQTAVATVSPSITPRSSSTATKTATPRARPTPIVKPDKFFDCVVTDKKEFWFEVQAIATDHDYKLYPSAGLVEKPESPLDLINYAQIKTGQKLRVTLTKDGDRWRCDAVSLWGKGKAGLDYKPVGKTPRSDDE